MNSTPLHAIPSRRIRHVALSFARHIELDAGDGQTLYTIHAVGRASRLHLPAGWMVVCVPLSGWLQLESAEGDWSLPTGQFQVWPDDRLRIHSPLPGSWVGIAGPLRAWAHHADPAGTPTT